MLDLELLVEALLVGVLRAPLAGDDQLAPADLELDLRRAHPGELGAHHGARGIGRVVDVDRGRERAAMREPAGPGPEHVAEQLVHLAPHALEVCEQVAFGGHAPESSAPERALSH